MINDVSARDVMDREPLQITLCKCRDTGPHFVTDDEVPDVNTHPPSPRAGRSCHSPAGD
ncbi:MAG: hypothetical protein QOF47_742 [Mycobacterium sp.]|jgi:hypothetical protein|nr:hypothetical protein [Mycobacterium sp.]